MSTHVVLGTGPVGTAVANLLASDGHTVRAVNRSGNRGDLDPAVTLLAGDLTDPAFAASALSGADVAYQVTQPAYDRWEQEFPALQRGILAAAEQAGTAVVLADNLYCYGPPNGPISSDTPEAPTTRKGRVRKAMADEALAAHADGRVTVALTRPSNYVGATYGMFREMVLTPLAEGKPARVLGRTDQPHSFSVIADAARAMVAVGTSTSGWGRAWVTPAMEPITQQELVDRIAQALGRPAPAKVSAIRGLTMRLIGLGMPLLRESVEMAYEFDEPFVVDSSEFTDTFGVEASSWDDAIAEMVASVANPADTSR